MSAAPSHDPALAGPPPLDPAPPGLAPSWSASPQAPRACRTPGCERLAAEPAELAGGMISAETLDKLPPGDATHADRVKRRTQLEALGLCFACADQIAQAPPLGEHVWMEEVCARCLARASETNSAHCVWRPRSLEALTTRSAGSEIRAHQRRLSLAEMQELADGPHLTAHGYVSVPEQSLRSPDQLDKLVSLLLQLRGRMSWPAPEDEGGA